MLTRSEATALVEALNEIGLSFALYAEPTSDGGREYEVGINADRVDLETLNDLLKVMERLPDAHFSLEGARITIW
jgi:hypothetical protein